MNDYSGMTRRQRQEYLRDQKRDYQAYIRPIRIDLPYLTLVLLSLLVAFFSVANPLFLRFADSLQTQMLYAGKAMLVGQVPYIDFYGSNGLFYYGMAMLGSILGNTYLLAFIQFLILYFSGTFFYKLVAYLTDQDEVADRLLYVFYLLIAALGFGGLYASLFALPFLLAALWFLLRYFDQNATDEGFIWYGVNGGIAFLMDPKSSLLWFLAGWVLVVYNIRKGFKARGIYQALATFFGFSLVVYIGGYYIVATRSFEAIWQTFLYHIEELRFLHGARTDALLYSAGFLVASGLATSVVYGIMTWVRGDHRDFKAVLYFMLLLNLIVVAAAPNFLSANLLILLPYALLLTAGFMVDDPYREPRSFLSLNAFLPVLALVYLFAYPAWLYVNENDLRSERERVAAYIRENTVEEDKIYVWDNSAAVYLDSQRFAATQIITPDTYLTTQENQKSLELGLSQHQATFIIVNPELAMPEGVAKHLEKSYKLSNLELKNLRLYQLK